MRGQRDYLGYLRESRCPFSLQSMYRGFLVTLLGTLFFVSSIPLALAQQDVSSSGRAVLKKVLPTYPAVAKRMGLGGVVKVEVTIDPKGSVKSTKTVGGSPVLANSAEEAIRRWQFQPGPDTNTQIVEFKFDPQN